jgi:hypothetical protein
VIVRTLLLPLLLVLPVASFVACSSDDSPGPPKTGSNTGGKTGTGGSSRTGGAKGLDDGGPRDDGSVDGGGAGGTGGAETSGRPSVDAGDLFPPLEGGAEPDAGTPSPKDCSPIGTATVPADPCSAFAEATCLNYESCTAFAIQTTFGDHASCVAVWKNFCAETYASPGQATQLADVHDCAAKLINAPCGCTLDEVCSDLVAKPGSNATGTACSDGRQCAGGVCQGATLTTCGTCKDGGKAGDVCGRGAALCSAGLRCGSQNTCVRPRLRGQRCDTSQDCGNGLSCNAGRCDALLPAGADCNRDALSCDTFNGVFCLNGKCTQFKVTEATGTGDDAVCGADGDGVQTLCTASAVCVGGHCKARGDTVGAACDQVQACVPELTCNQLKNECAAATVPSCGP